MKEIIAFAIFTIHFTHASSPNLLISNPNNDLHSLESKSLENEN
jgi:hypothetical protein